MLKIMLLIILSPVTILCGMISVAIIYAILKKKCRNSSGLCKSNK